MITIVQGCQDEMITIMQGCQDEMITILRARVFATCMAGTAAGWVLELDKAFEWLPVGFRFLNPDRRHGSRSIVAPVQPWRQLGHGSCVALLRIGLPRSILTPAWLQLLRASHTARPCIPQTLDEAELRQSRENRFAHVVNVHT